MARSFFILLLLVGSALQAGNPVWQPEKTWVFAVGVLQFDSQGLQTYPEEGRVDAVMIEALRKRGVPAENMVFIKNEQATKAHIAREFPKLLKRAGANDTLLFYYTGHGSRDYNDPARPVNFITYDTAALWTVGEIFDAIEAHFKGTQAILIADCCHSGGLMAEAARRSKKIGYGVLASSQPASTSTGNWTFTRCVAEMLTGHPVMDLNQDGQIEFQEAGKFCDAEMCFCEEQRACCTAVGSFDANLVMARSDSQRSQWVGQRYEAATYGIWLKVRVIDAKDGKLLVDWVDRPKKPDTWLLPEQLRKPEPRAMGVGENVRIEWNGVWYLGKILQVQDGLHLVHYEGYPSDDDEWVPLRRLRPRS